MFLMDASASVVRYMAQPHRLEFLMPGAGRQSIYFPDFEARVPLWFASEMLKGEPFAKIAMRMPPQRVLNEQLVTLVLEIKTSKDRRVSDPKYLNKLRLAKAIYSRLGYYFFVINDDQDIKCLDLRHMQSMAMDGRAKVSAETCFAAWSILEGSRGGTSYRAMVEALGGGPLAREATNCLHMQGLIWIDLMRAPHDLTRVAMPPLLGRNLDYLLNAYSAYKKAA